MTGNIEAETSDGDVVALTFTSSLKRVHRSEEGTLIASGFMPHVCECCGEMRLFFTDAGQRIFAWMRISPDDARDIAAMLIDQAAIGQALGAGRQHKH